MTGYLDDLFRAGHYLFSFTVVYESGCFGWKAMD